jgi:hypothetical protein
MSLATPGCVQKLQTVSHASSMEACVFSENQTVNYVLSKEKQYFGLTRGKKSVWEAAEYLNTLVDDSDPDTDLTQLEHLLQTSRGDPQGRSPPLDGAGRIHPRPRQVSLLVW